MKYRYGILLIPLLSTALSADPKSDAISAAISAHEHATGLNDPDAIGIATKEKIKQIAFQWITINGGMDDQETIVLNGYFSAIRPIKGFADSGDVIWELRFIISQRPTRVLWVNQKTGKVEVLGRIQ